MISAAVWRLRVATAIARGTLRVARAVAGVSLTGGGGLPPTENIPPASFPCAPRAPGDGGKKAAAPSQADPQLLRAILTERNQLKQRNAALIRQVQDLRRIVRRLRGE